MSYQKGFENSFGFRHFYYENEQLRRFSLQPPNTDQKPDSNKAISLSRKIYLKFKDIENNLIYNLENRRYFKTE
ncbi:hypothetical protein DK846_03850 [Methanospirillum lacunae]|uniref:Uncharacterized protein n=1 Tax=Methanospirillum lacunae TaxID=668570 RepID=A0A2V2N3C6_9EURY|nr:hypothetical protein DK846_03850 [Methanospirillum lacunae]